MNWENVNLKDGYERNQNILDPYNFDTLLLEISCNIREENLNNLAIIAHFEEVLQAKVREAREIFRDNLNNIVKEATNERK